MMSNNIRVGGTIVLFDRKVLRNFRKDGHNWRKKQDGKTVKEAHEHLKVRAPHYLLCYNQHIAYSASALLMFSYFYYLPSVLVTETTLTIWAMYV